MTTLTRPFAGQGVWLRGNLHGHTTNSDGARTPAEALDWYAGQGYDFVALTDHLSLTSPVAGVAPNLIQIPGSELHVTPANEPECHIVVLGEGVANAIDGHRTDMTAQQVLDRVAHVGASAFIAHPYRLGLTRAELLPLRGAIGIEIWNSTSDRYGKALSTTIWDSLLEAGWRGWGLANDDVHWRTSDYGQGWSMVWAEERSTDAILAALRAGRFYASRGPAIYDLAVSGYDVSVACSAATAVHFVGNTFHCTGIRATDAPLHEVRATMPFGTRYVRIEVIDEYGRMAWSQPVWIE